MSRGRTIYDIQTEVKIMMLQCLKGVSDLNPLDGDLCMIEEEDAALSPQAFLCWLPAVPSPGWGSIPAFPPSLPCFSLFIRPGLLEWMP